MAAWAIVGGGFIAATSVGLARWADAPSTPEETPASDVRPSPAMIERGEYLARAANCSGCHTRPGGEPFGGGLAIRTPFGTIYASNITPDPERGIGRWSDADFLAAMYRGISRDGHHLYPAFPYTSYTHMTVPDVLAIKAYLFAQPPVPTSPSAEEIVFPFNQRWGIAYWNLFFNSKERFKPDPTQSPEVNRGAYLVEGAGHCGGCHTPRNILYAERASRALGGAIVDGLKAYNITSDPVWGIGRWSTEDLVSYLRDGYVAGHGPAGTSMGPIVQNSLSQLAEADLRAIASYLKASSPIDGGVRIAQAADPVRNDLPPVERRGRILYAGACAGCHGWGGATSARYVSLLGSRSANDPDAVNLIQTILRGGSLETNRAHAEMPGFGLTYSDAEVAALARYIFAAFGPSGSPADAPAVRRLRSP
jgi:mono/diheme cytochrome c family protein